MFKQRNMTVTLLAIIVLQNMMPILDAASIESKQLTNTNDSKGSSLTENDTLKKEKAAPTWSFDQQEIHVPEESEITLQEVLDITKPKVSGSVLGISYNSIKVGRHRVYDAGSSTCDGEVVYPETSGGILTPECQENWDRTQIFTSPTPITIRIPLYSVVSVNISGNDIFSYTDSYVNLVFDNLVPTLTTDYDSINVGLGADKLDYIEAFNPTVTGENSWLFANRVLILNDTCEYNDDTYSALGTCTLDFMIQDDNAPEYQRIIKTVTVNVVDTSNVITVGSDSQTKEEEIKPLTDSELIDLFKVSAKDSVLGTDLPISVDSSSVDYDHPGDYKITFSAEDSVAGVVSKDVTLTLSDIKPSIETDSDSIDVLLGTDKLDYTTVFNPTITGEKVLNDTLTVNDSCSYDSDTYNKAGACTIEYAINDDDSASTKITKTVTVNVIDPKDVITIGSDSETKEEEIKPLTDSELIDLFKVSAKDSVLGTDLPISVDSSSVDYTHPGDYTVTFSVEDSGAGTISRDTTLTLSDIKPGIETGSDSVDVLLGSDKLDYATVFNASIVGEKELNDNTIVVDDSCLYDGDTYNALGTCTVEFAINDDDSANTKVTKTVTVNVIDPSDLLVIGNDSATKEEEIKPLTDSELIDLFQVSPIDSELGTGLDISVDSTAVDYDHPGDYKVTFTIDNPLGGVISKDVTLTLSDIKPTISTKVDSAEVSVGDDKLDYASVFNPSITGENVLNDDTLTVDDTKVDYSKAGEYAITYSVSDDDAKESVITKDEKVIVNPKQVTPQSKVDKIKMTLATTGLGQTMMMLIIAVIVLIILTVLRYRNRRA